MKTAKTTYSRRNFLKVSTLAGGGMVISIHWLTSCKPNDRVELTKIPEWKELNAFVSISSDNVIKIMSPNPEGGQGVKTSMPMIVAEELDVDWEHVVVEQADLDTEHFTRQFIGGSQAIHQGWKILRTAGATAKHMLKEAASNHWQVPIGEIQTESGVLHHKKSGKSANYGEMAIAAAQMPLPKEVTLKDKKDFKIIGKSQKNVDLHKIVTGKPLFGIDTTMEGCLIAMIVHPPAFGLRLKSIDDTESRKMPGIRDIFSIKIFQDDYERQFFDTNSFNEIVAILGDSTWQVMQGKKALIVTWEPFEDYSEKKNMMGRKFVAKIPAGQDDSIDHYRKMEKMAVKPSTIRRNDGDPTTAFKKAEKIIERTYTGPFLAHNCMEPMNFFANVTDEKATLIGPLQKPEFTEHALSKRLGLPLDKIDIHMTRLGGGFGRRSYAHWMIEAALISQKIKAPVKLMYSREDDMTSGIYRSTYTATFGAALSEDNQLVAFKVTAGGIPESPLFANRFPAGAIDHYIAEDWTLDTNITVGSFRAPRSNFMAAAEQSFLDEVAEAAGKDPIDFRLELLKRAGSSPVGKNNEYDASRYAGVLEKVREISEWDNIKAVKNVGVSAYFCHDTYVAHVLELDIENDLPVIKKVWTAIDCGMVINPDAAKNMAEGAIIDGIGTALYGNMSFTQGVPDKRNFDGYRMIRMKEAPKEINVHFVENLIDPSGMGEPAYPPIFGALANALFKATGKRFYKQPYLLNDNLAG